MLKIVATVSLVFVFLGLATAGTCTGKNEVYSTCASCPRFCNESQNMLCAAVCREGCDCIEGYIRDSNGNCIPPRDCPNQCEENEIYNECGTKCPGTCSEPVKSCEKICVTGCFCKEGYLRLNDSVKKCVKKEQCPRCS